MTLKDVFKKKIRITIELGSSGGEVKEGREGALEEGALEEELQEAESKKSAQVSQVGNRFLVSAGNWAKQNAGFLSFLTPVVKDYAPELKKAGIYVEESDFLAFWDLLMFVGAIGGFVAGFVGFSLLLHDIPSVLILSVSAALVGFSAGLGVPIYYISSRKSSRKSELDAVLPFIVERFASYVEAGAPLRQLIESFNDREIYGIWIDEIANIRKEINFLGIPPTEALMNEARRSPSELLSNFLSSFVIGLKSSLDLKALINHEREVLMNEKKNTVEKFLESLGALTESVISLFVILPITILTMGMIASTIGGGFFGLNPVALIVVTSFVLMPLLFLVAMESVSSITPKM